MLNNDFKVIAPGELLSLQSRKPSVYAQVEADVQYLVLIPWQPDHDQNNHFDGSLGKWPMSDLPDSETASLHKACQEWIADCETHFGWQVILILVMIPMMVMMQIYDGNDESRINMMLNPGLSR